MATVQWSHSEGTFRITYSVTVASNNTLTVNITKLEVSPTYYTGYFYPDCKIQVNGVTALTMDCNEQATHRANCTSTGSFHTVTNYRATPTGATTTASVSGIAAGSAITISCVGNNYSNGNSVYMYYKNVSDACFTISNTSTNTGTPTIYTVSYNANGGSGAPSAQKKASGQNLTLSSTKPTRASTSSSCTITYNANGGSVSPTSATSSRTTSYTFKNWNTNSGGTGTSYNAGATYTADANATLYAQWNSSTGAFTSVTLPTPTRSGYNFIGWSTSSTATSGTTGSYTPTGNVTLYAIWKQSVTYHTITLYHYARTTSGSWSLINSSSTNVASGATYVVPYTTSTIPAENTKNGSTFIYWTAGYGTQLGTGTTNSTAITVTQNLVIEVYYPLITYAITYDANGGSNAPNNQTKIHNTNLILSTSIPTREGYIFIGWSTSENGKLMYSAGGLYTLNQPATLYAVWSKKREDSKIGFAYVDNKQSYVYIKIQKKYIKAVPYICKDEWKVCT